METVKIETAKLDDLLLDATNPRLGRRNTERRLGQDEILELMQDWTLDELAVSFLESGFWPQEALIVVRELVGKRSELVVVEGNRRLAALKMLALARAGKVKSPRWTNIVASADQAAFDRLKRIPYIEKPDRNSVQAYLGYRHVTGIKEWAPAEKAQFIAHLIEDEKLSYDDVRRRIGSKMPAVRQNYISYRLLLQMEEQDDVSVAHVEEKFSVLYLSLRTAGAQKYLDINIEADPSQAKRPVPKRKLAELARFALWLFGNDNQPPLVTDSRQIDAFGALLESDAAVDYLERTPRPIFEVARRKAGVDEAETSKYVESAGDQIEEALRSAHLHKKSTRMARAVLRVARDVKQLLELFPAVREDVEKTS